MKVRTRFAPSPTGYMHIGNLRTALYTYFYTRQAGGDFILRIEDTDTKRYVEGAVEAILKTLKLVNMTYDEGPIIGGNYGPYYQSERKKIYEQYAQVLIEKGEAYYCFCKKERLETLQDEHGNTKYDRHCLSLSKEEITKRLALNSDYVIRQKMPVSGQVCFEDELFGTICVDAKELEDQILLKSDKMPTYNFANVVDDHLMAITHVIRGMEYLSSAPKYNLLYQAFGWEVPKYIHLSSIMRDENHKLSKRDGDANFEDFYEKGYLPAAIINYISLLGWAPKDSVEKFTMAELIERFNVDGLKKSGSIFDEKKLQWFNFEYLKEFTPEQYFAYIAPFLVKAKPNQTDKWYRDMAVLVKERLIYGAQVEQIIQDFFTDEFKIDEDALEFYRITDGINEVVKHLIIKFNQIEIWDEEHILEAIKQTGKDLNVKGKMLYMPCRIVSTGEMHGPDLGKLLALLGREKVLKRMNIFK